ncbi:molybdate transport system substrate-binding protein [Mobilisporobacter senegalensis]|uniref:Molybdate transport system substrate-binding protein n=1 Tax=Mobilisporobacter senegalensis TaxID=1329262 RepID=A0A3N1XQN1_9FIRM|nr:molybdate ABC transporter substrate-binding protein [Mobilisporobacter senegalensis]ROR28461.1 molybdate transport system substrate-binding protein [Mobilisporobacter senegalensis]
MIRKRMQLIVTVSIIAIILLGCRRERLNDDQEDTDILIAAAVSLQKIMDEIQIKYHENHPQINMTFTYGSSGSLEQQIEQGAPVDVFISAAQKQMDMLKDKNLIIDNTLINVLENKVILIVPKSSDLEITGFEDILKASKIALGDPDTVPAGQYAKEIFTYLNILDAVKEKTTYGKDVAEVFTWVSTGNADAGVVYETDALSNDDVKIVAKAPEGSHSKIIYPAAVIKNTKEEKAAKQFLEYLQSKEAREIFEKHGFTPIE